MTQKKVSVRLVAEGGRQVKAEFQGIGDAGENHFKRIERQADITGAVVRRLAGIVAGALSIRQIVAYADSWTDLRSRVDLATGSQQAGAAVMDRLAGSSSIDVIDAAPRPLGGALLRCSCDEPLATLYGDQEGTAFGHSVSHILIRFMCPASASL